MSHDREPPVSGHAGGMPSRTGCGCLLLAVLGPLWLLFGLLPALVGDDLLGPALGVRWSLEPDSLAEPSWTEVDVPAGTPLSIRTGRPGSWSCEIRQADGSWQPARWRDTGFWHSGSDTVHEFRAPASPVAVRCAESGRKPGSIELRRDDAGVLRTVAYRIGQPVLGLGWLGGVTVVLFGPWIWVATRRGARRRPGGASAGARPGAGTD